MSTLDYLAPASLAIALFIALVLVVGWQDMRASLRAWLLVMLVVIVGGLVACGYVDCSGSWQECTK